MLSFLWFFTFLPVMLFHFLSFSFDDDERSVFQDVLTHLHADGRDGAVVFGLEVVGHLHGFEHDDHVALLHLVAHIHLDVGDDAGQRCLHGVVGVDVGGRSGLVLRLLGLRLPLPNWQNCWV